MRMFAGFVVLLVGCMGAFAEQPASAETEALKAKLQKEVSLGSVNRSSVRDEKNQKVEVIKTTTEQDEDSTFTGVLRFTAEFTDRAGTVFYGQVTVKQKPHPKNYEGKDEWEFRIPHGDLKQLQMGAYAMEFGFEDSGVFVSVAQKFSKVKNAEEIISRNKDPNRKLTVAGKTKALRQTSSGE